MTILNTSSDVNTQGLGALPSLTKFHPSAISDVTPLFDIVPTALLVVDSDLTIIVWNVEMEKMTGYSASDVMNQSLKAILPEIAECIKTSPPLSKENNSQQRLESQICHSDGHTTLIGFTVSRLHAKDFFPNGIVLIARDISEQERRSALFEALMRAGRQAALARTAEQAFSAMSDELGTLNIWSLVAKLEDKSDLLRLHHIDLQSMPGIADLHTQDKQEQMFEEMKKFTISIEHSHYFASLREEGQPVFVEKFVTPAPQVSRPRNASELMPGLPYSRGAEVIIAPLWQDQEVNGLLMVGGAIQPTDVVAIGAFASQLSQVLANVDLWQSMEGQIVQRSERLYQEQVRLNAILKYMADAVIFTDAQERIQYVNPAWEKMNGYSLSEVFEQRADIVASSESPESVRHKMSKAAINGEYFEGELVNRRKDGSTYEVYLTMVPVHAETGELEYFVGVLRDISEEKRLARSQENFIGEMSHELRTPLTNIQLYLSLLEKGDTEQQGKYLNTIKRESKRLHQLIEGLLAISRHDQGRYPFTTTTVDLNKFLQRLVEDRAELAHKDELSVEFAPQPDLPFVSIDPSLIEQVLAHLLTNAITYAKKGCTILVASCKETRNGLEWIGFSVSDTGYGITEEELPLIFERFYRGSTSKVVKASGTGLGLSLCKQFVDLHGGHIDVKSKPNEGSTFTVWLPA